MFATYFFGCWWLPVVLVLIDIDCVKLGKAVPKHTILAPQVKEDIKEGADRYSNYGDYNERHDTNYPEGEHNKLEESALDPNTDSKPRQKDHDDDDDSL
jgi:hypothetical protein